MGDTERPVVGRIEQLSGPVVGQPIDLNKVIGSAFVKEPAPEFEHIEAKRAETDLRNALEEQHRLNREAARAAIRNNASDEVKGILNEIAREHGQGLALHGGEEVDDEHVPMEWYGLASLQLARGFLASEFKPRLFRSALVRTAALLVAAIRWVDRNCEVD